MDSGIFTGSGGGTLPYGDLETMKTALLLILYLVALLNRPFRAKKHRFKAVKQACFSAKSLKMRSLSWATQRLYGPVFDLPPHQSGIQSGSTRRQWW